MVKHFKFVNGTPVKVTKTRRRFIFVNGRKLRAPRARIGKTRNIHCKYRGVRAYQRRNHNRVRAHNRRICRVVYT